MLQRWQMAVVGAGSLAAFALFAYFVFGTSMDTPEAEPAGEDGPASSQEVDLLLNNASPALGSPDAIVTLIEFGDYQCVACSRFFHNTEGAILENYVETGKVKLIFKDYTIIGQDSVNAAHGSHCASEQGMFWEYHDILYSNWAEENTGWASSANLIRFASEVELDVDAWRDCMNEARYLDRLRASNEDARDLELPGTPSFFVIGPQGHVTTVIGPQPYETFSKLFELELAR